MTTSPQPDPQHEDHGNLEVRIVHMTQRIGQINLKQMHLAYPDRGMDVVGYIKNEQIGLLNMAIERYCRDLDRYRNSIDYGD